MRDQIPYKVWEVVKDVNIFKDGENTAPEQPADPMVCNKEIKLSKCERAFLRKGPKFMLRQELNENEFAVELQKMIIKDKFDKTDSVEGEDDPDSCELDSCEDEEEKAKDKVQELDARARLVYDKADKSLNLGRLRATDYKFNRYIHLPCPESSSRESLHEVRKQQMMKTFREVKEENEIRCPPKSYGAVRRMNSNSNKKRACPAKYSCP